jgi:hypothetical protein
MAGLPWFRVEVDLTDHPKIHALEARVGDSALSYVVRLWSWTMRYAARGRLADGARTALESACRWRGVSGELVAALIATGFLDEVTGGLEVHDWWVSQGKVVEKAENDARRKRERRADGAGTARAASADGAGTRRDETRRDETIIEEGKPPPPLELVVVAPEVTEQPHRLQTVWNDLKAPEQPRWKETSKARKAKADSRWKERDDWPEVVKRIAASSFCRGTNDRGWVADPDWLLKPDTATKVLEGKYDDRAGTQTNNRSPVTVESQQWTEADNQVLF